MFHVGEFKNGKPLSFEIIKTTDEERNEVLKP
jgi:hypothetical protein